MRKRARDNQAKEGNAMDERVQIAVKAAKYQPTDTAPKERSLV